MSRVLTWSHSTHPLRNQRKKDTRTCHRITTFLTSLHYQSSPVCPSVGTLQTGRRKFCRCLMAPICQNVYVTEDCVEIMSVFLLQAVPVQRCRHWHYEQGRRHASHPRSGRHPGVGGSPDQQKAEKRNSQPHASDWKNYLQVGAVLF